MPFQGKPWRTCGSQYLSINWKCSCCKFIFSISSWFHVHPVEYCFGWKWGTYIFPETSSIVGRYSVVLLKILHRQRTIWSCVCSCYIVWSNTSAPSSAPFFDTDYNKQSHQLLLTLDLCEPVWLVVVFRGNGEGVEKHKEDHQPVENIGLDSSAALSSAESIPSAPVATWKIGKGKLLFR